MTSVPICLAWIDGAQRSSPGPDLTRYLSICGLLVLAIVGLAWGFRRLAAGTLEKRAARRSLQVLDVLPLGGKRQLTVVRCYDRTFALGLGEKEVSLVAELDPSPAAPVGTTDPSAPTAHDFERTLSGVRTRLDAALGKPRAAGTASTRPRFEEVVG